MDDICEHTTSFTVDFFCKIRYASCMRILIATGIYPPATSGPAQYAVALEHEFRSLGHDVRIKTFGIERRLPSGIRHLWFFVRILPNVIRANVVFALDTFSVGWPAVVAARMLGKKIIIRTGGDFLFEQYIERTNAPVVLSQFYSERRNFSLKERMIFFITRLTLHRASALVFSTKWQRDIWMKPYALEKLFAAGKIFIVENRFDKKIANEHATVKNFIFATRKLKYKNIERFEAAFALAKNERPEITLELYHNMPHEALMEKIKTCYACVMPSLGEISPHFILDAVRYNKPFILTLDSGYAEKLKNVGVFVDPLNITDMMKKILWLSDDQNYSRMKSAVQEFSFTHLWNEIAGELLMIIEKI